MTKRQRQKELSQPDRFHLIIDRLHESLVQHRSEILFAFVALLVLIGLGVGVVAWMDSRERRALDMLEAIELDYNAYFEAGNDEEREVDVTHLITRLDELAQQRGSTKAGGLAFFYLGELYYQEERYEDAVAAYQGYLNKLPKKSPYRAWVLTNIGYSYEALSDFAAAAESFLAVAQMAGNPLQDDAYLNTARVLEKQNKVGEARQYYQRLIDEFPDSPQAPLARTKLALLASKEAAATP